MSFLEARAAYEEGGLDSLSLEQMQVLIAGEWDCSLDQIKTLYTTLDSARHFLIHGTGYQTGVFDEQTHLCKNQRTQ